MDDESGPALGAGAVATLLGVAVTTLRSWDRRYGIGPSSRESGRHRRYTPADLERLREMRRLVYAGVPPAEAARAALRGRSADGGTKRTGGGRTIPVGRADRAAQGLARAAVALDGQGLLAAMREQLAEHGTRAVWTEILTPLLVGIGMRWEESGGDFVEVEHLVSWCASTALRERASGEASGPVVLLAAAPGEEHTLALEALAAAGAERGRTVRMLGARVPGTALAAAAGRLAPARIVVWAQIPEHADADALPEAGERLILAGPGWSERDLPPGTRLVTTFDEALDALEDLP
ncbi:MerR family transcriptional regulator [Actinocorallia longicatena]|uniref:MerR family transcriptional regulator n=1 Tax=Actinocorallia longicatena TaxID=111803 RepID=A0ABP6PZU9_9ACTN